MQMTVSKHMKPWLNIDNIRSNQYKGVQDDTWSFIASSEFIQNNSTRRDFHHKCDAREETVRLHEVNGWTAESRMFINSLRGRGVGEQYYISTELANNASHGETELRRDTCHFNVKWTRDDIFIANGVEGQ